MADQEKTKRIFQKPNGFEKKQMEAKKPDNDNEDDNDKDNEIDNDLLSKEEKEEKLQQRFVECLNSFNTNAINECISYLKDLPFSVIDHVLTKTSGINNPNWNYAKAILDNFIKRKIDTLEKIEIDKEQFLKQKEKDKKGKFEQREYKNLDFLYANTGGEDYG